MKIQIQGKNILFHLWQQIKQVKIENIPFLFCNLLVKVQILIMRGNFQMIG